jgi:hypothetical protein
MLTGAADTVVFVTVAGVRSPSDWRLTAQPPPRRDALGLAACPQVARWLFDRPGRGVIQILYFLTGDTPIVEVLAPSTG